MNDIPGYEGPAMSTEPRECCIFWNGLKSRGEWQVGCDWENGPKDSITIAVPFIEHSAYRALEQKLAVAVRALEQYKDFEITRVIEGGLYSPKLGSFKMEKLSEHTWNPAKEALEQINADARKASEP